MSFGARDQYSLRYISGVMVRSEWGYSHYSLNERLNARDGQNETQPISDRPLIRLLSVTHSCKVTLNMQGRRKKQWFESRRNGEYNQGRALLLSIIKYVKHYKRVQ